MDDALSLWVSTTANFLFFCPISLFYLQADNGIKSNGKQVVDARVTWNDLDARGLAQDPAANENSEVEGGGFRTTFQESDQEMDDIDWEDGSSPILDSIKNHPGDGIREVTIEFSESPDSAKQKPIRRATAEEKVTFTSFTSTAHELFRASC